MFLSLILSAAIISSAIGYGSLLLKPTGERSTLFRLGLGIWLLSLLVYGTGLTGDLRTSTLWLLLVLGFAIGLLQVIIRYGSGQWHGFRDAFTALNLPCYFLALFILALSILAVAGALTPPVARDSLVYHLALPKLYLQKGQWLEVPHNIYSYFPGLGEAVYTLALGLGSEYPALMHSCIGAACLAGTYELGRLLGLRKDVRLFCVAGLLATPTFFQELTWAYVDLANTFFWILTATAFLRWIRDRRTLWLVLLGFSMGAAYSCKYTSLLLFMFVPLGILLELRQDENVSLATVAKSLAIPTLLGMLAASPWWLRNVLLTGNPFFPFFWNLFPSTSIAWDGERTQKYSLLLETYGGVHKGLIDYLLAPFRVFMEAAVNNPDLYDGKLGWYYLLSLPLVLFWRKLPGKIHYIIGLIGVYLVYWTLSSQQARFLLVILPFISLLVGCLLQTVTELAAGPGRQILQNKAGAVKAAALLAIGTILLAVGMNARDTLAVFRQERYLDFFLGQVTKEAYLKSRLYYYEMYQFINHSLPADANLLLVTTGNQGYYLERRFYSDAVFEHHTMLEIIAEAGSAQEMIDICRQRGWTHLLIRLDYFVKNLEPDLQGHRTKKFYEFLGMLKLIATSGPLYLFEIPPAKDQGVN